MNKMCIMRKNRRFLSAFTLMEVVVGIAILSMLSIIAWSLLSGWMGTSIVGIWRATTNKALGIASTHLRNEISKASYPSAVTPEDTIVAYSEEYFTTLYGSDPGSDIPDYDGDEWEGYRVSMVGPGRDGDGDSAEEPVIEVYQGLPGKARIPGFEESDVGLTKITYFLKGHDRVIGKGKICNGVKSLYVRRETGSVTADGYTTDTAISLEGGSVKLLVSDVNCVMMGVPEDAVSGDASDLTSAPAVKLKIFCVEHQKGKANISVTLNAAGQTGVKFEG